LSKENDWRVFTMNNRVAVENIILKLRTWCPECQSQLSVKLSYPFRDYTMRVIIECPGYYNSRPGTCTWSGLYMELPE
jgi:hypothetical protein